MNVRDRFIGCLLGLAIGDALGMPFEGWSPVSIKRHWNAAFSQKGLKGFLPSPSRGLRAGQYTDDTLMALCHVRSLIEKGGVAPEDIGKRFIEWYDSGNLRGIGGTTAYAIRRLKKGYNWQESGATGELPQATVGPCVLPL
ncbi:MAG TPA: ADP-ribosylglycohydrolase family protein [Candidatus Hypogeohydataceae bacterium YC41]